jgi:hypothetical protein
MSPLARFLHELLYEGRISLHAPPAEADDPDARKVLRRAHAEYVLTIAGLPLPLDEKTALAAAGLLHHAAWYFLNPGLAIAAAEKSLRMPAPPARPEHHLSADLVLRFVPALQRRAQALLPNDPLPQALEHTLRHWPLSGVLADIVDPPLTPVDFGPHPGPNFLYAERLAQHERPGWFPLGPGMQYVELVWHDLGKDVTLLPALRGVAAELREGEDGSKP